MKIPHQGLFKSRSSASMEANVLPPGFFFSARSLRSSALEKRLAAGTSPTASFSCQILPQSALDRSDDLVLAHPFEGVAQPLPLESTKQGVGPVAIDRSLLFGVFENLLLGHRALPSAAQKGYQDEWGKGIPLLDE